MWTHFDAVIIPGSNYIQQRECNYLAETVMKLMDSYDLPFILIGVGAQMSLEDTLFPARGKFWPAFPSVVPPSGSGGS